jgi:limonene-1,2-epoxide hydrolase
MSIKNKKVVIRFMSDFMEGKDKSYMKILADDIRWNIVGMPSIYGKQNFIQAMDRMDLFKFSSSEKMKPIDKVKNLIAESDFVVVESSGKNSNSCSCDVYKIKNGKIEELTSYIVDTSVNEEF